MNIGTNAAFPARARELLQGLRQDGGAPARLEAAQAAVDRLVLEFPEQPEPALVLAVAAGSERLVTREEVIRLGLDVCAQGCASLPGVALQLAALGWDDPDRSGLTAAGFEHLAGRGELKHPLAGAVRKAGESGAKSALLAAEAGQVGTDLHEQAVGILAGQEHVEGLGRRLVADLSRSAPEQLAYGTARAMMGSTWLTRLAEKEISTSLLQPGVDQSFQRLAKSVKSPKLGWRAIKFAEKNGSAADRAVTGLTRLAHKSARGAHYAYAYREDDRAKLLGAGVGNLGGTEVAGNELAACVEDLIEASLHHYRVEVARALFKEATEMAPEPDWKAAFRAMSTVATAFEVGDCFLPIKACKNMLQAARAAAPDTDRVIEVARAASGHEQAPIHELERFLAGEPSGVVRDDKLARESLAAVAEEASDPRLRGLARLIRQAMDRGELAEDKRTLDSMFEMVSLAEAAAGGPSGRVTQDVDSVCVGGVVIRKRKPSSEELR